MAIDFNSKEFKFEICCDACHRLIEPNSEPPLYGAGIVAWTTRGSRDFVFLHKHWCDDRDKYPYWVDLDFFLKELVGAVDVQKMIEILKDSLPEAA